MDADTLLYYVVYLLDADEHIVIPWTWIRDAKIMLKKFVNYGLNSNQTHLCFWSEHVDAKTQDGRPNVDYQPIFDLQLRNEFPCYEGVYRCHVIKFTTEYEEAISLARERRERVPARYYQRRVLERPLPNLERARPIEAENVMGVEAEIPIEAENPFAADNQIEAGDPIADENPIAAENQIEDENDAHADFGMDYDDVGDFNGEYHENMEQEELIPSYQQNPIVLLERIFVQNQAFEAAYDMNAEDLNETEPVIENVDPLNEIIGEGLFGIKYEIQHDYDEVDGILNDNGTIEFEEIEAKNGGHVDGGTDRAHAQTNSGAIPSSSGMWKEDSNEDGQYHCKVGAVVTQLTDEHEDSSVEPKVEYNENNNHAEVFDNENAVSYINTIDECDGNAEPPALAIQETLNNVPQSDEVNANGGGGIVDHASELDPSHKNVWKKVAQGDHADDDVLFIEPEKWPKAKTFELTGFVKRENDRFSGNLPFSLKTKNKLTFREYIVGFDRVIKVPVQNVETCIKWSTSPFKDEITYDQKIAHAMLTLTHTKTELNDGKVNRDAIKFVERILSVRTKDDLERMAKLPQYMQEILQKNQNKN